MRKIFLITISAIVLASCNKTPSNSQISEPEIITFTPPTIEKREISFENTNSYSWARLKIHPTRDQEAFLPPEIVQNAASFVDETTDKVVRESLYFLSVEINNRAAPEEMKGIVAEASLELANKQKIEPRVEMNDIGFGYAYRVMIDTNDLAVGNNELCLKLRNTSSEEEKEFCRTIILSEKEIQQVSSWREPNPGELTMYISPQGYFVKINGVKFFFNEYVFRVGDLKYSPNKDLVTLAGSMYEGSKVYIYDSETGEQIDDSISHKTIWKNTEKGYRIYSCYYEYYVALKYLDLNPITREKSETILLDPSKLVFCEFVNEKMIRYLELIPKKTNIFIYREYDIDQDKIIYQIEELDMNAYVNIANYLEITSDNGPEMVSEAVEKYRSTH